MFGQCYICREFTSHTTRVSGAQLCYPCWGDIVRLKHSLVGRASEPTERSAEDLLRERPDGSAPDPRQLDIFG